MAVKKSTAPKGGAKAPKAKAAAKKAAPKAKAEPKAKAAKAPKGGAGKKAAPKKAAVKLTPPQQEMLKKVAESKEAGMAGTKGTAKQLNALLEKKLIKKGKKQGDFFLYHVTKAGEKHIAASAPPSTPESAPAS